MAKKKLQKGDSKIPEACIANCELAGMEIIEPPTQREARKLIQQALNAHYLESDISWKRYLRATKLNIKFKLLEINSFMDEGMPRPRVTIITKKGKFI